MSSAQIVDGKVVANYTAGTSLNKEMKGSDSYPVYIAKHHTV